MRRYFPKIVSVLLALAVCSASGAHWMLLQSVAWAGMVVTYAQDRPLAQAVSDTFDGEHPCDMCKAIADGKKSERKLPYGAASGTTVKMVLYFVPEDLGIRPTGQRAELECFARYAEARRAAPPVPPPRLG